MKKFLRLLNFLPPEFTFSTSHLLLTIYPVWKFLCPKIPELRLTKLCGLSIRNPIGLGAGIDKNGDLLKCLIKVGLGFITIGSVTLKPRTGNPKPRLVKIVSTNDKIALINALGLPSKGIKYALNRVERIEKPSGTILILNIAGFTIEEFIKLTILASKCKKIDALELNLSCPNIKYKVDWFNNFEELYTLLREVTYLSKKVIFVKIPPLSRSFNFENLRKLIRLCEKFGISGITAINTYRVIEKKLSTGFGGLSGFPIYKLLKTTLQKIREINNEIEVIACGGVLHGHQVKELIEKYNVNATGIVTAFAFEGPYAFYRISRELMKYYFS